MNSGGAVKEWVAGAQAVAQAAAACRFLCSSPDPALLGATA